MRPEGFGESLRALRVARGLGTVEAAVRAGVSRGALLHWEAGRSLPKGASLERLLDVLEADARLRGRLLAEADPRHARVALARSPLGPPVAMGAVLRAMRSRRGLTQAGLARAAGVTQGAVAKWESGDSAPSSETAHSIAHALGATAEEAVALAAAWGTGAPGLDWKDPEDGVRRARAAVKAAPEELGPVVALALEAEAWRRAAAGPGWDSVLCYALSQRAHFDYMRAAPGLGEEAARRAVGLAQTSETREAAMSGLDIATMADRRRREDPTVALDLATEWAGALRDPVHRAWALTIRSHRLARLGRTEEAERAVEAVFELVMAGKDRRDALQTAWNYRIDLQLRLGRNREALRLLDERPMYDRDHTRSVRALHANGLAAPEEWMETLRARRSSPEADWQVRGLVARLERRQAQLLGRVARA